MKRPQDVGFIERLRRTFRESDYDIPEISEDEHAVGVRRRQRESAGKLGEGGAAELAQLPGYILTRYHAPSIAQIPKEQRAGVVALDMAVLALHELFIRAAIKAWAHKYQGAVHDALVLLRDYLAEAAIAAAARKMGRRYGYDVPGGRVLVTSAKKLAKKLTAIYEIGKSMENESEKETLYRAAGAEMMRQLIDARLVSKTETRRVEKVRVRA